MVGFVFIHTTCIILNYVYIFISQKLRITWAFQGKFPRLNFSFFNFFFFIIYSPNHIQACKCMPQVNQNTNMACLLYLL